MSHLIAQVGVDRLSTHSDTTLQMLRNGGGVSDFEQTVLGAGQWNSNEAVLHWDERVCGPHNLLTKLMLLPVHADQT